MIDPENVLLGEVRLSSWAELRSRPNGFSTTMRALVEQSDFASPSATVANRLGGIAK
jgi:hypothetical protein